MTKSTKTVGTDAQLKHANSIDDAAIFASNPAVKALHDATTAKTSVNETVASKLVKEALVAGGDTAARIVSDDSLIVLGKAYATANDKENAAKRLSAVYMHGRPESHVLQSTAKRVIEFGGQARTIVVARRQQAAWVASLPEEERKQHDPCRGINGAARLARAWAYEIEEAKKNGLKAPKLNLTKYREGTFGGKTTSRKGTKEPTRQEKVRALYRAYEALCEVDHKMAGAVSITVDGVQFVAGWEAKRIKTDAKGRLQDPAEQTATEKEIAKEQEATRDAVEIDLESDDLIVAEGNSEVTLEETTTEQVSEVPQATTNGAANMEEIIAALAGTPQGQATIMQMITRSLAQK